MLDPNEREKKTEAESPEEMPAFDLPSVSEFFQSMTGSDDARKYGNNKKMSKAIKAEALERAEEEKEKKFGKKVMLETTDLIKQYRQYDSVVTAVNRVNLTVLQGEFVAIIGTSGSGKSTLLHLCAGMDRPNSGVIRVGGQEITNLSPDGLSRFRGENIGMIFQNHNLLPQFTAMENILVPTLMCSRPSEEYEGLFRELIASLDIADRLHHLPSELSGGQQQRVAIARALINSPKVVFADEPTGNLDRANADEVLKLLLDTRERLGQTLIMVTHDMAIAEKADRIFRMENGCLTPYRKEA